MSSTQNVLTDTFSIRKTRSYQKKVVNDSISLKCPSSRPRRYVTRLFTNENEEGGNDVLKTTPTLQDHDTISSEHLNQQPQRSRNRRKPSEEKKENAENSPELLLLLSKSFNEVESRLSPRKNLSSVFDSISSEERNYPEDTILFPIGMPESHGKPKRTPKKPLTKDEERDNPEDILFPNRTPESFGSPKRSPEAPTKDQENCFRSPNGTPKRQSTEQLRLVVTSPPKRKKDFAQGKKTFTPIALFKQNASPFQAAKEALHSSTPSRLVGRDQQMKDLSEFLENHMKSGKTGSLYISGAPGTGKTACLTQMLNSIKEKYKFMSIFVNCMSINHSAAIFEKVSSALGAKRGSSIKESIKIIENKICNQKHMVILVLDEMDQLSTKNQQVLYSVFEWLRLPNSNLVLIGIANTLNMTGQILPRLDTCRCPITLLHFPTYSQGQITAILQDRLKDLTASQSCVIKPQALQFCARKIAAQAGDVRKALDTCRRAVELVEKLVRTQQVLRPTFDDGMNPGSPRRSPRKLTLACVELSHIQKVLHDIYGSRLMSSKASESHLGTSMPIQQKLLLCTLLLISRQKKRTSDLTLSKLRQVYSKVCQNHKMEDVAFVDFQSMCSLAESKGLVQIRSNKETRLSKIVLNVDEDDLQFIMSDKSLLAAVLQDQSVLAAK